jgi:hypothetical protein
MGKGGGEILVLAIVKGRHIDGRILNGAGEIIHGVLIGPIQIGANNLLCIAHKGQIRIVRYHDGRDPAAAAAILERRSQIRCIVPRTTLRDSFDLTRRQLLDNIAKPSD